MRIASEGGSTVVPRFGGYPRLASQPGPPQHRYRAEGEAGLADREPTPSRQHKAHQPGIWRCDAARALPRLDAAEPAVFPHRNGGLRVFYCKRMQEVKDDRNVSVEWL